MDAQLVIVISSDMPLCEKVARIIRRLPRLRMVVYPTIRAAQEGLDWALARLILVHDVGGGADVAELLRELAEQRRPTATLVLGEQHQPGRALMLLRFGAADYLSQPYDLNRLAFLIDVLTLRSRYEPTPAVVEPPAQVVWEAADGEPFLYLPDQKVGRMMVQVRRVAPQDTTILLGGETGTGKTRLARLVHDLSPRRERPFLVVNCGALSTTLIESEMFGHIKGAFTGADRDRAGKFAEVGAGTLLLDEIDSLPLVLQAKLLRAVEERVFEPVGSNQSMPMRARLIVASNRELDREAAAGRFRADLYYRLNVVSFRLPPLRERHGLIPHLARTFVAEFAGRACSSVCDLTPGALHALQAHSWPGNIRELRNVIERAVALCDDTEIQVADLPDLFHALALADIPPPDPGPTPVTTLPHRHREPAGATLSAHTEQAEAVRINEALAKHRNNRLRAAAELGISRMTLYNKLRKYGMI